MTIVADHYKAVVGVDTHAATHTYALIESPSGKLLDQKAFTTTTAGISHATAWIGHRSGVSPEAVLVSAEGTGSYGAIMAGRLTDAGYRVVEAPTPSTKRLRGKGKTDALDALTAARSTLIMSLDRVRDRRAGEIQTALRLLTLGREQMNADRVRSINAVTALVRSEDLGIDARHPLTHAQILTIASWRHRDESLGRTVARSEAIRLAKQILTLDVELKSNRTRLTELVDEHAPTLIEMPGVGAVTAAVILTVWSHPGRIRSEAALAQIAGTCPIPASSGKTIRHRLNRGGDRQLNKAINTIALTRMRADSKTRAYVAKRLAEGRTKREITRCLKCYITRQIHRTLTTAATHPTT